MNRITQVLAGALTLVFLLSADAAAQVRPGMGGGPQPRTSLRFYGQGVYAQIDVDELNERLAGLDEPYSEVSEDMIGFGVGLHGRRGHFILGAEATFATSLEDAEVGEDRIGELSAFQGSALVGFSVIRTAGLDFYPLIQLGGAGASLEVRERGAPAWDDILADPGRRSTLTTGTFYGAAGAGLEYAFRNGFFVGARGTWAFTPKTDSWTEESGDVLGGPEMDLSGPSVRLMAGFGGRGGD
jgi:hypothetical protein